MSSSDEDAELQLIMRLLSASGSHQQQADDEEEEVELPDAEGAALLVERAMFHFMRFTTLRRNQRLPVGEEELQSAISIVDHLFRDQSLLRMILSISTGRANNSVDDDEERGADDGGAIVSNIACVILDELLCFLDETQSVSVARSDPPSFHARRVACATQLLTRLLSCQSSSSNRTSQPRDDVTATASADVVTAVFRQTLPGVASRCCVLLSKAFNSSCSAASTKPQRETCCAALKLLRVQLRGCDFASWVTVLSFQPPPSNAVSVSRAGVSAFIRVANLVSAVVESFMRLLLFHVEQGGVPLHKSNNNSNNSTASAWFSSSSSDLRSAISGFVTDAVLLKGGMLNEGALAFDDERATSSAGSLFAPEQLEAANDAKSALHFAALRWICISNRWIVSPAVPSLAADLQIGEQQQRFLTQQLNKHMDDICFQHEQRAASSGGRQHHLRNLVLHDAAVTTVNVRFSSFNVNNNNDGKKNSNESAAASCLRTSRRQRLWRCFVSAISSGIEAVDAMQRAAEQYQAAGTHSSAVAGGRGVSEILAGTALQRRADDTASGAAAASGGGVDLEQLTDFEKWLVSSDAADATCPPFPKRCSLNFIFVAAAEATERNLLLPMLSAAAAGQEEEEDNDEQHADDNGGGHSLTILERWLEIEICPVLDDPFEFDKHHALMLLVSVVIRSFLTSSSSSLSLSSSSSSSRPRIDALNNLLWSDAWPLLWDGVVLARYPRALSEHWERCNAAQRRFRVTLNGLVCKVIAAIGTEIAQQQAADIRRAADKRKKGKSKQKRGGKSSGEGGGILSDAADRFLLLAVRELLNIASTEADQCSIARDSAMAALHTLAASFGPLLMTPATAAAAATEIQQERTIDEREGEQNSSHGTQQHQQRDQRRQLLALMRHCIASVVDVCARELQRAQNQHHDAAMTMTMGDDNTDSPSSSVYQTRHKLLGNCRVLAAASLLCVQQQQQQQPGAGSGAAAAPDFTATADLLPSVTVIAEVCSTFLRQGFEEGQQSSSSSSFLFSSSDPEVARAARSQLLRTALSVAEFAGAAMRQHDAKWMRAAAEHRQRDPSIVRDGNIVRKLYKSGALKRAPKPGEAAILSTDSEWMDVDDFNAFVDSGVAKLHALVISILGCAVASLGAQYFASAASSPFSSSSSSSSSGTTASITDRRIIHRDTSLLQLEQPSSSSSNHQMESGRWNAVISGSASSHDNSSSLLLSSSLSSSAAVSIQQQQQQRMLRQWTNTASIAERVAGVKLCMACLRAVATSTPASYFEMTTTTTTTTTDPHHSPPTPNDNADDAVHPPDDPSVAAMITTSLRGPPMRVARGHWTSVFKVFHALQSLLLSSRGDQSTGFRDIPSAIYFFHRFTAAVKRNNAIAMDSSNSSSTNNNQSSGKETTGASAAAAAASTATSTREKDAARIELRSCIDSLKRAQLLADESIAQVPDACVFLVTSAPVFLLYRTQTEVLPLLGLQWLSMCYAKEPEIWTAIVAQQKKTDDPEKYTDNGNQKRGVEAPRTVVGRTFRGGMTILREVCGLVGRKGNATNQSEKKSSVTESAERDIEQVRQSLDLCLL